MENLIYFFIAFGLSMDAFSLAIIYGTNKIKGPKALLLSLLVGFFHYIMPLLGSTIGKNISFLIVKSNYLISIIFILLAIEMYKSKKEEHNIILTSILSLVLFSITVSIDSFSVGIALGLKQEKLNIAFIIFSIVSSTLTYIGLTLGNYLSKKYGLAAINIGIIILILLAIKYLIV